MKKIFVTLTSLVFGVAVAGPVLAADAWPASTTGTQIASGLSTRNTTSNGFEASGVEYLSGTGYIVVGDDGDIAVLSTGGLVSQYWNAYQTVVNDFEDIAITDTTATDNKIYLANEYGSKIEEFNVSTGAKTGKSWTLSDLYVSGGSGFEALAYVPDDYAPASWGTAQSGGFFIVASQAENVLRVYTFNRTSSTSVSAVATITLEQPYYDIGALQYSSATNLLYVVYDSSDKLKEYSLTGVEVNSYYLPNYGTYGSDGNPVSNEGFIMVPNCSTGQAQVALAVDNVSSSVKVYSDYPITCTTTTTTVDADGDGVNSTLDCNDNDITVSSNQTYYRDADGDGLGNVNSTTSVCSSTAPDGYTTDFSDSNDSDYDNDGVSTASDCNDLNNLISAYQTYYRDADGDGLGTSATTSVVCSYSVTSGYVTNASDSNDSDYDNDGVSTSSDCNDSNSSLSSYLTVYQDADGDGLGNPAVSQAICALTAPTGYVTNASDSNDSDYDNDGVSTASDCNDSDNTISAYQTYYRDADGDGLGTSATTSVVCSYTVPTGYVTNASDSNDSDYDNDGVSSSADCNDSDNAVSSYLTVYQDFDGDGLGNPAVSQAVCSLTAPTGYVTNASDTDDSGITPTPDPEPTYSPVEYADNNIDDDGDGSIDEINTLASNGVHPTYGEYDPNSVSLFSATVATISGSTKGRILVRYADNSVYQYQVFSTTVKRTTVTSYHGTGYLLVKSGDRRKVALVNAYTGEVFDYATLKLKSHKVRVRLAKQKLHVVK